MDTKGSRRQGFVPAAGRAGLSAALDLRHVAVALALVFSAISLWQVGGAHGAVTHSFLPGPSAVLDEHLSSSAGRLAADSGHLLVSEESPSGATVVSRYDATSGEPQAPRLVEEGGLRFIGARGIAVAHPGGGEDVYVTAGQNGEGVIGVYGAAGTLAGVWTGANTPNGSFTQSGGTEVGFVAGVAVDGSGNPATSGDVYVATAGVRLPTFNVVDVFAGGAPGGEPAKVVGTITGTCATPGVCPGKVIPFVALSDVAVSGLNGDVLVTDNNRVVDVFEPGPLGEYGYVRQLAGTPTGVGGSEVAFGLIEAVAVDGGTGDIYVATGGRVVDEFSSTGAYLGRLRGTPAGPFSSPRTVAVDAETHEVFVEDIEEVLSVSSVDVFGPDVFVPDVVTSPATGLTPTTATVNGTVDPVGAGEATCRFVWGETKAFGNKASCVPEHVPNGEGAVPVKATLTGLSPDTEYFYRLQASDGHGENPGEESQDRSFRTLGAGIHGEWASNVASMSGTVDARVDPNGAPTTYFVQYASGDTEGCPLELSASVAAGCELAPGGAVSVGSGEGDVPVERHLQGLTPGATYHYRVVAISKLDIEGKISTVAFPGADREFTTQPAIAGSVLPDARQWELVSPVDKHGSLLLPIAEAGIVQASSSGAAVTYLGTTPTEEGVKGYFLGVQIFSSRGPGGWSSQDIALPHSGAVGVDAGKGFEYKFFSEDLTGGLVEPHGEFTSLAPDVSPLDSEATPYVRHDSTCASAPAGCFEPLLTSAPGSEDVRSGTHFGSQTQIFRDATADLSHLIIASQVPLTDTPINGKSALYEWTASAPATERLKLVSVLGNGEAPAADAALGFEDQIARGAVSGDGSRVVWSETSGAASAHHLYMRDLREGEEATVRLDGVSGGSGAGVVQPQFQFATSDGSRVFFTDTQQLTADSGANSVRADLYECEMVEVAGELNCALSDLTPKRGGEEADVQGAVIGASNDGSWVYFVANGVLAEGAHPGDCHENTPPPHATCDLYLWHEGTTKLVTVLSGNDWPDWIGKVSTGLEAMTARVTPDGKRLVFMSERSITGYDNSDTVTGHPDEEVYSYNADENSGAGNVVCVSCNPTGARPAGVEYAALETGLTGVHSQGSFWRNEQGIAADIPGWTAFSIREARYQSRYLSADGRVFFNTSDGLVPQDINGSEDVYEYEPAGVGGCSIGSATFVASNGGCVALISSGAAAGESGFLDASESGNDVFFLTGGRLVSADTDTALDVYDARVCSALEPCPGETVAPPACGTADACRVAPSPQPAIFGSPSSATFVGAGNIAPSGASVKPRAVVLTRAQKLARALRACRKDRRSAKRAACVRQAHRRYGVHRAGRR